MARSATKPAAKAPPASIDTAALARELLGIYKKLDRELGRIEALKAQLKAAAGARGENFKEVFDLGQVKVSAPKPARVEGEAPELQVEAFLQLTERDRKGLIKQGLVAIVPQEKGAYYGAVTVELF